MGIELEPISLNYTLYVDLFVRRRLKMQSCEQIKKHESEGYRWK
jgi:hypothetical protein